MKSDFKVVPIRPRNVIHTLRININIKPKFLRNTAGHAAAVPEPRDQDASRVFRQRQKSRGGQGHHTGRGRAFAVRGQPEVEPDLQGQSKAGEGLRRDQNGSRPRSIPTDKEAKEREEQRHATCQRLNVLDLRHVGIERVHLITI